MTAFLRLLLFTTGLIFAMQSVAVNRALLIGISDYQDAAIKDLQGPQYDVQALQQILLAYWQFTAKNITLLQDKEAKRNNILQQMERLLAQSTKGDFVLLYFSGHGTSLYDERLQLPVPDGSGALVPSDFKSQQDRSKMLQGLLIGKRDLRPLFKQFDNKKVDVLVVIDACFSGNTVRGKYATQQGNQAHIAYRHIDLGLSYIDTPAKLLPTSKKEALYPYQQVIFVSAASEKEKAVDELNTFRTIDNKPHGALTDGILRILSGKLAVDSNHDKIISNWEFFSALKRYLSYQNYMQTPQLLYAQDSLLKRKVFPGKARLGVDNNNYWLGLKLQGEFPLLKKKLVAQKQLQLVHDNADFIVQKKQNKTSYQLLSRQGDMIAVATTEQALYAILQQQLWLQKILRQINTEQQFQIKIWSVEDQQGETFTIGEVHDFAIVAEQDIYLLVVSVSMEGNIKVLYPLTDEEVKQIPAYQPVVIKDLLISPPEGVDYLIALGFKQPPNGYVQLRAGKYHPGDKNYQQIITLLQKNNTNIARYVMKMLTVE